MKKFYESLVGKEKNERLSDTGSYKIENIKSIITNLYIEEKIKDTRKEEILDLFKFSFEKIECCPLYLNITIDRKFITKGLYEVQNSSITHGILFKIFFNEDYNIVEVKQERTKNHMNTHSNKKTKRSTEVDCSADEILFILKNINSMDDEKINIFKLIFDKNIENKTVLNSLIENIKIINSRIKKENNVNLKI